MKRPEINRVEVDMVPLIDIISLLLMFLIIVGDSAAAASAIEMKLPAASEAKAITLSRVLTIQMDKNADGRYDAVVSNKRHKLDGALRDYLEAQRLAAGGNGFPVRLRIPEKCGMVEVEKVVQTLGELELRDVLYAAAVNERDKQK